MDWKLDKVREFAVSEKAYRPPREVNAGDSSDIQDLDEIKLHELKEVSGRAARDIVKRVRVAVLQLV